MRWERQPGAGSPGGPGQAHRFDSRCCTHHKQPQSTFLVPSPTLLKPNLSSPPLLFPFAPGASMNHLPDRIEAPWGWA